jgi:hypothetical protein
MLPLFSPPHTYSVEEVKHRVHNTKATDIGYMFLLISTIFHFDREFLSGWQISTTFFTLRLYALHNFDASLELGSNISMCNKAVTK